MSLFSERVRRSVLRVAAYGIAATLMALAVVRLANDVDVPNDEASRAHLEPTGRAHLAEAGTENAEAFDLCARARDLLASGAEEQAASAIEQLQEALRLDPDFARARANLGLAYLIRNQRDPDTREAFALAERAADQALALDPTLSEALAVQAVLEAAKRDWQRAGERFERALALEPNDPASRAWYARYLFAIGRLEAASSQAEVSLRLRPAAQWRTRHAADLGFYRYALGDADRALALWNEVTEKASPASVATARDAYAFRAAHHQLVGDHDAMFTDQLIYLRSGGASEDLLPWARRRVAGLHNPNLTAAVIKKIREEYRRGNVNHADVGLYAADLGAYGLAAEILEDRIAKSFEESRDVLAPLMWLWHPRFREFRQDEAFKRLLERLGLVAYWREHGWGEACRPLDGRDFECR